MVNNLSQTIVNTVVLTAHIPQIRCEQPFVNYNQFSQRLSARGHTHASGRVLCTNHVIE